MTYLTPDARTLLDDYLTAVRAALAGCRSVDADEIEQDICAHISAEFPAGPVSKRDLEPVLTRLGRPEQWAPDGERSVVGRAAEELRHLGAGGRRVGLAAVDRLRHLPFHVGRACRVAVNRLRHIPGRGLRAGAVAAHGLHAVGAGGRRVGASAVGWLRTSPDDWRLAYLAFGLLAVGLVIPPLLIGLLPASYCVARAAVALAAERDEPLGPRRWLVYPPLVLVYLLVGLPLVLWPILAAGGAAHGLWHELRPDVRSSLPWPEAVAQLALYTYLIVGAMGAWLVALGTAALAAPRAAAVVFRPFVDPAGSALARRLFVTGLAAVLVWVAVTVRYVLAEDSPLNTVSHRAAPVVMTDW